MLDSIVTAEQVEKLLRLEGSAEIDQAVHQKVLVPAKEDGETRGFLLADIINWRLAQVMVGLGVEPGKAKIYAETVLNPRLAGRQGTLLDWAETPNQELYCLLEDSELARIYLRDTENRTEADVGAVKPVLLPTTRCEINVSRVIRPIVYRAKQTLGA
jgi:hypothetical protein